MSDLSSVSAAVDQVAQGSDPKSIADELVGQIRPILQSAHASVLESHHQVGTLLKARLKPDGQKRHPYGGKVMERLAELLDISRSSLGRMIQFASQHSSFAAFKAHHPTVTTWAEVKILLATRKPASQQVKDLTKVHLQQCSRSLANYLERFRKGVNRSHGDLLKECQRDAQALAGMFQQHLSNGSTTTPDSQAAPLPLQEGGVHEEDISNSSAH